ncbi:MAG: hypothetical protein U0232_30365 [Thermomicrobiales bacterium]
MRDRVQQRRLQLVRAPQRLHLGRLLPQPQPFERRAELRRRRREQRISVRLVERRGFGRA